MSLNALAPDQRAVVQLVLQQERTYDDLADLLGISREAVRARAVAGLIRIDPGTELSANERERLTDYILGQQGVSERERSRELLSDSPDARRWARTVVEALSSVTGAPPVDIPGDDPSAAVTDVDFDDDEDLPDFGDRTRADEDDDDEDLPDFGDRTAARTAAAATAATDSPAGIADTPTKDLGTPVAAGPRPRPRKADAPAKGTAGTPAPKSSKLGGILLIAGLALVIAAALLFLFRGNDDDDGGETAATPTATAQATPAPAFEIDLAKPRGAQGDAKGKLSFYVAQSSGQAAIAFVIEATGVPESREGETYGVWLTGNNRTPRRLGFTEPVGQDGRLGASGPEEGKESQFVQDLGRYTTLVISRETSEDAKRPGDVVLQGRLPRESG